MKTNFKHRKNIWTKIRMIKILGVVLLLSSQFVIAQDGAFEYFNTSRFARVMRLGNAYTGVAEGPETMFYNAAGLADVNSYSALASTGQGFVFYVPGAEASDMAITVPVSSAGTAGASINSLSHTSWIDELIVYRIYSLSYAHKFFNSLNIGLTANYYDVSYGGQLLVGHSDTQTKNGNAFDISIGALYKLPVRFYSNDEFKLGFQFKNVLNNKLSYDLRHYGEHKLYQNMRAGTSYTLVPEQRPVAGFIPFKLMVSFDAVYLGEDNRFTRWQPNYGVEFSFVEVFQVSIGRETERQIKRTYYESPQYPVIRYGAGLRIPINKIFELNFPFVLRIDYCKSDWERIDEDNEITPYTGDYMGPFDRIDVQDHAVSVGVDVRI